MPNRGFSRRFTRFLAIYAIVVGAAVLLAPGRIGRLSRWFADNPRYLRLAGVFDIGFGTWLVLKQHREEQPPRLWWQRVFGS
jgi:hypothetical protein